MRLSLMEREELSYLLAAGSSLRAIGQPLGRAPSNLARELVRQHASPVTYRAVAAHQRAQRWSPEQIARGLPQRYPHEPTMRISHEAIYTYLYVLPRGTFKRELVRYLRRRHRSRRPRKGRRSSRPLQDLISIDERPPEVADRTVPGHWEGLACRPSQAPAPHAGGADDTVTVLVPLKAKDAAVRQAFAREQRTLPAQLRLSLTDDKGRKCASTASSRNKPRCRSILRIHILPGAGDEREHEWPAARFYPRDSVHSAVMKARLLGR